MYSFVLFALLAADPLTLAQIEAEALANNAEIQSVAQQTRIAESRLGTALALDDPQFAYRAWGTPLLQPWNLNQTQHMFMFMQNVPGKGKRELRYLIASDDAEIQRFLVEAKKREVVAMVRRAFYQLLRTYDNNESYRRMDEWLDGRRDVDLDGDRRARRGPPGRSDYAAAQ